MKKETQLKRVKNFLFNVMLIALAFVTGVSSDVFVANATNLPQGGVVEGDGVKVGPGGEVSPISGVSTEGRGREVANEQGNPNFYLTEVDKKVLQVEPMSTPLDTLTRYAKKKQIHSMDTKTYRVGSRPVKTVTNEVMEKNENAKFVKLAIDDANFFSVDDTIRVVGVPAKTKPDGTVYGAGDVIPDLVLCVGAISDAGDVQVFAVNGKIGTYGPTIVGDIPANTVLVRMGKACGEMVSQTGRFNIIPDPEKQYCQKFMAMVEQSTIDKATSKEVKWDLDELELASIRDMKLTMENSFLFSDGSLVYMSAKNGKQHTTKGAWWQAKREKLDFGTWDEAKGETIVTDNDLVDVAKEIFTGLGGSKRKIWLCGSEMMAALSKLESEKYKIKDDVEYHDLKFKSWDTNFGEILTIHHELFDLNGMSHCALSIDEAYIEKHIFFSFERCILDFNASGQRDSNAVVLKEISCVVLTNPESHARIVLARA